MKTEDDPSVFYKIYRKINDNGKEKDKKILKIDEFGWIPNKSERSQMRNNLEELVKYHKCWDQDSN